MRRAAVLVVALLASSGGAAAASLSGDLTFRESAAAGLVGVDAGYGVLDLAPEAGARGGVAVSWTRAEGYEVWRQSERYALGNYSPQSHPDNRTLRYGPGSIQDLACPGRCQLILLSLDEGGRIWVEGDADGPLGRVRKPVSYVAGDDRGLDAFRFTVPRGWLHANGADAGDALPLGDAVARADGALYLYVYGAQGTLVQAKGAFPFWTGVRNVSSQEIAGVQVSRGVETRFVVLRLEGARLETEPGTLAQLYAPGADVRVDGTWSAEDAHGHVRAGGTRAALDGASVAASGELRLAYSRQEHEWRAILGGDAEALLVDGAAVHEDPLPSARLATGGVAFVAFLVLALATLRAVGWLPAYTRIQREDILENENRRRILALVQESPGVLVTELAGRVGVTETVVRYHLRMLVRAKLLTTHEIGRVSASYPTAAALDGPRAMAVAAMRGRTREALAGRLLAATSGMTQRDLAEATSASQRLVAYHLAEMARVGLVAADDGRPQRYVATPLLRECARPASKLPASNEMAARGSGRAG